MYCRNCGFKNEENSRFCGSCGSELHANYINQNNGINIVNSDNKKKGIPVLSWISFGLLMFKILTIVISIIAYNSNFSIYLMWIPSLLGSLITAIISRVMNKDTMSLVVMIIDIILIALGILAIILFVIILGQILFACGESLSAIG